MNAQEVESAIKMKYARTVMVHISVSKTLKAAM